MPAATEPNVIESNSAKNFAGPRDRDVEQAETKESESVTVYCPAGLDSGDIVLFNRSCMAMPPYGAVICAGAKLLSNSKWDHLGIVIRRENGDLYLLEATVSGVKSRPLADRLRHSKSHEIAVRRLDCLRTVDFRARLLEFERAVVGAPYERSSMQLLRAIVDTPSEKQKEVKHIMLLFARDQVDRIDGMLLNGDSLTLLQKKSLAAERERLLARIAAMEEQLALEARRRVLFEAQEAGSAFFCSQLAAAAYQTLGLLPAYPASSGYVPKDWSTEQQLPGMRLLGGATLGKEQYLRLRKGKRQAMSETEPGVGEREAGGNAGVDDEWTTGGCPTGPQRAAVRAALSHTQAFALLTSDKAREELLDRCQPVELRAGEVLFFEGDPAESIYVLVEGKVERLMSLSPASPGNANGTVNTSVGPGEPPSDGGGNAINSNPDLTNPVASKTAPADPRPLPTPSKASSRRVQEDEGATAAALATEGGLNWRKLRPVAPPLQHASVAVLSAGTPFGVHSMVHGAPRGSTMRAVTPARLWRVRKQDFDEAMGREEEWVKTRKRTREKMVGIEKQREELREYLRHHYLFKGSENKTSKELESVLDAFFLVKVKAGDVLFEQGDPADNLYIIRSGLMEREQLTPSQSWSCATLTKGDCIGDLSLMFEGQRECTVRARSDAELWAISSEAFQRLHHSAVGARCLRLVFKRSGSRGADGQWAMTREEFRAFLRRGMESLASAHAGTGATSSSGSSSSNASDASVGSSNAGPTSVGSNSIGSHGATIGSKSAGASKAGPATADERLLDMAWRLVSSNGASASISFLDFLRFDTMMNHTDAEYQILFRLADEANRGYISSSDLWRVLEPYVPPPVPTENVTAPDPLPPPPRFSLSLPPLWPWGSSFLAGWSPLYPFKPGASLGPRTRVDSLFDSQSDKLLTYREFLQRDAALRLEQPILPPALSADITRMSEVMQAAGAAALSSASRHGRRTSRSTQPSYPAASNRSDNHNKRIGAHASDSSRRHDTNFHGIETSSSSLSSSTSSHLDGPDQGFVIGPRARVSHLAAGALSGALAATLVAPLDRIRILLQTQWPPERPGDKPKYRGIVRGLARVVREEGWRGLYRSNGANVARVVPAAVVQLLVYDQVRHMWKRHWPSDQPGEMHPNDAAAWSDFYTHAIMDDGDALGDGSAQPIPVVNFLTAGAAGPVEALVAGSLAGACSALATYPLDLIRGKLAVQPPAGVLAAGNAPPQYAGIRAGLHHVIREGGVRACFRGLGPTLVGVMPLVGIHYTVFETLKPLLPRQNNGSGMATEGALFSAALMASATAQLATYPLDVCRRRMQVGGDLWGASAGGAVAVLKQTLKEPGTLTLFRGGLANLAKLFPSAITSYYSYKMIRKFAEE
eukprot:jgi/Mesvir1/12785/Mv22838-RA.1